jgi:immune inhibitor A
MKKSMIHAISMFVFILAIRAISCFAAERTIPGGVGNAPQGGTVEKGIVILVEFPDVQQNVPRNFIQSRFKQQLPNYVRTVSYNKVSLEFDITSRWYKLPGLVSQYRISSRNLEVDKSRVKNLIDDSLAAADADVDFSKYSFVVIFMGAKVQDYGMIGLCGYPGMLGWDSQDVLTTKGGERIEKGVAIFCYQAHVGTLFHDLAHILGGVKDGKRMAPCLYDHDLQAKPGPMRETFEDSLINMGFWDPMSCHYYKMGVPPPEPSSWTRIRLGWIDPSKIKVVTPGKTEEVILGPLEDGASSILTIRIPVSPSSYYLIENRQPIGSDKDLPGSGVLIMYADDTIPECRNGKAPVRLINADPSVPHLEGAAFEIGKKDLFQDAGNRVKIALKEKIGSSYKILITP